MVRPLEGASLAGQGGGVAVQSVIQSAAVDLAPDIVDESAPAGAPKQWRRGWTLIPFRGQNVMESAFVEGTRAAQRVERPYAGIQPEGSLALLLRLRVVQLQADGWWCYWRTS